jgi:AcrR family transcriptional regulator
MAAKASHADKNRLSSSDWEKSALAVIARRGVAELSVESLARELGVTKGSFYWHFEDRTALLESALDRWQTRYTAKIIDLLAAQPDPRKRVEFLVLEADRSDEAWRVHVALSASAHEPAVAKALARVSKQRVAYLEECFRALGASKERARQRALLAYTAYLGFAHLKVEGPAELPSGKKREAYLRAVLAALLD